MPNPNFLIVGAPKSGTTAIVEALRQHPQVFLPKGRVEPGFFAWDIGLRNRVTSWPHYRALFREAKSRHIAIGEKTVWYLTSPSACRTIAHELPGVKIVVAARTPIEHMHAMHRQQLLEGNEHIASFERALSREETRTQDHATERIRFIHGIRYRYLARLEHHIESFIQIHGDDHVHVVLHEELRKDFSSTIARLLRFLGVSSSTRILRMQPRPNREVRSPWLQRTLHPIERGRMPWLTHIPGASLLRSIKHEVIELNAPIRPRPALSDPFRQAMLKETASTDAYLNRWRTL